MQETRAVIPLSLLRPGEGGTVVKLVTASIPSRVLDLGIMPGIQVRVIRRAPLGDPVEVSVNGCRMVLREGDLRNIYIEAEARR